MPSTLSKILACIVFVILCTVCVLIYYVSEAYKRLSSQEVQLAQAQQNLQSAKDSIIKLESSSRELRAQLSVIRVALQQSVNIDVDASGAIITKKGSKADGIELR